MKVATFTPFSLILYYKLKSLGNIYSPTLPEKWLLTAVTINGGIVSPLCSVFEGIFTVALNAPFRTKLSMSAGTLSSNQTESVFVIGYLLKIVIPWQSIGEKCRNKDSKVLALISEHVILPYVPKFVLYGKVILSTKMEMFWKLKGWHETNWRVIVQISFFQCNVMKMF